MRVKNGLLCTLLLGCCLWSNAFGQQAIQWQPTLEMAKQLASQTNRLVLVHFWSPSCEPCRRMERDVFTQPEVIGTVEANYVAVKLNADHFPATARQFGVSALPTDIVITPDGQMLDKSVGAVGAGKYTATLTRIAASVQQRPNAGYAQSAAPGAGQTLPYSVGTNAPVPAGYPNHPYSPHSTGGGVAAPPAAPYGVQAAIAGSPPPSQQGLASPPAASYPTQPGSGQVGGLYPNQPMAPQAAAATPQAAVASMVPGSNGLPPGPSSAQAPPAGQVPPQVASGNPPLGLDGYCPVQLSEKERWVKGNPRWGLIHRGRTYLFAGPEEQSRFYADPDRYAPAYSGSDIVLAVEQGAEADGRREHGAWFDGRVYLFTNEESYNRFNADPYGYVRRMQQMATSGNRASGMPTGRY